MASAEEIVSAFVAEFDAEHPDPRVLAKYFSDDAVYHNMPMEPAVGIDAVRDALVGVSQLSHRGWETVHQAASGDVVLNERVDRFVLNGKEIEVLVCGVFEIRDGKIAAWRDYFDMASMRAQME